MKRIIGAVCLFAVILAGTIAPRFASAHAELTAAERAWRVPTHLPEAPVMQVELHPDSPHDSIRITWEPVHGHIEDDWSEDVDPFFRDHETFDANVFTGYEIITGFNPALITERPDFTDEIRDRFCHSDVDVADYDFCGEWLYGVNRRLDSYSLVSSGFLPATTYYVRFASVVRRWFRSPRPC